MTQGIRRRGGRALGVAFVFLVFLEVFAAFSTFFGMLIGQTAYASCTSDHTVCADGVGGTALIAVPIVSLAIAITTWTLGAEGPPTLRRRVWTPAVGLGSIVVVFLLGLLATDLSIG
ncbi:MULTISPECIES: hypothetical protein [unclassified Curtobacterium]|uniref:hypothetical protein n=1 Tax=unclassified Curtobacterium TaxID=257496 RepID=UPI000347D0E2|nr:hypothetical protein [Curtobacterium sp. B18]